MTEYMDAETLREWLAEKRPVQVIDIRSAEDRAQWSIPGSIHVDAYEALRQGRRSPLTQVELAMDVPIVTVCNLGRMSVRAAAELGARGFAVVSLRGGMKAWSLAWNVAEIALRGGIRVTQVRRTGKGCLSYLLCHGGEAVVIDAALPEEVYLSLAEERGARIRYVMDTHIHADHLSRSRSLAEISGAELLMPPQDRALFAYRPIADGEIVLFGGAGLKAMATPGHTMESTSYVLDGEAVFTGDTLFTGGVGRPDLHADPAEARARGALLYRSEQQLFGLGAGVLVFAGHTGEPAPFDGVPLVATLGEVAERLRGWFDSEGEFIERVLARIPPAPPNYERIVECNERGELPAGDPTDLEAGANRCAVS